MKHKDAIKILVDIEKNIAVDQIQFRHMKIWPLVRLEIWKNLLYPIQKENKSNNRIKDKTIHSRIIRKIRFLINKHQPSSKSKVEKNDAVFLIAPIERLVRVENKYFSPFSNSMKGILDSMGYKSMNIDLARKNYPIYGDTYYLDRDIVTAKSINKIKSLVLKKETKIDSWDVLNNFIRNNYPQIKLKVDEIMNKAEDILLHQKILEKKMKKIKPKVAFLVCFYYPEVMGFIRACHNLGIQSVEIQHGQQGDYHGMYTNWTNLPKDGYDIMPSRFWCWGEKSSERINKWAEKTSAHQAFVGGNPWIHWFINNKAQSDMASVEKLNRVVNQNKKNVFVALQPEKEPLPPIIIDTIKNSPENIHWIIGMHPALQNRKEEILHKLSKTNNSRNIGIQYPTEIYLFDLFKKVDFIITLWSSVAYEALVFRIHPIIAHPNGGNAFKDYIEKGLFSYAPSSEEILNIIHKNKDSFDFKEKVPYINIDEKIIQDKLLGLIKND